MDEQQIYEYNLKYIDDIQARCLQYRNGAITAKQFADQVAMDLWYIRAEITEPE